MEKQASCTLSVGFNSHQEAEIALKSLEVDQELKRNKTTKNLTVVENKLNIEFLSPNIKELRKATSSFLDSVNLVVDTIEKFGPAVPPVKKRCIQPTIDE